MKQLLDFILKNLTGSDKYTIEEEEIDGRSAFRIIADKEIVGLIIGKQGQSIKNIRKLLLVSAALHRKSLNLSVTER